MPHTSHKKKTARPKRTQVVDEDGWTRVTSTPHHQMGLPLNSPTTASKDENNDPDAFQRTDGPHTDTPTDLRRLHAPEDQTEERLLEYYELFEKRWKESGPCKELSRLIRAELQKANLTISTCVCFGTGSPSGLKNGWIDRHSVAAYQIAAFKCAVDVIGRRRNPSSLPSAGANAMVTEEVQGSRPQVLAQEPDYNDADVALLTKLHIGTVDHPMGFERLDEDSFAFCPGAEQDVIWNMLQRKPALFLGSRLDFYRREWVSRQESYHAIKPPEFYEAHIQSLDNYVNSHTVHKLPDLPAADHPFHDMHLYSPALNEGGV